MRSPAPKAGADIYVLGGLMAGEARFYDAQRLRPVLSGPDELSEWISYCRRQGRKLPAGLHVETGMNRLAFTEAQLREVAAGGRRSSYRLSLDHQSPGTRRRAGARVQ